jgi:hypothetical protein
MIGRIKNLKKKNVQFVEVLGVLLKFAMICEVIEGGLREVFLVQKSVNIQNIGKKEKR